MFYMPCSSGEAVLGLIYHHYGHINILLSIPLQRLSKVQVTSLLISFLFIGKFPLTPFLTTQKTKCTLRETMCTWHNQSWCFSVFFGDYNREDPLEMSKHHPSKFAYIPRHVWIHRPSNRHTFLAWKLYKGTVVEAENLQTKHVMLLVATIAYVLCL